MEYYLWKRKRVTSEQKSTFLHCAFREHLWRLWQEPDLDLPEVYIRLFSKNPLASPDIIGIAGGAKFRSSIGNCSFNFVRNDGNCDGIFYWRISCSSCSDVSGTGNSVSCHSDLCTCGNCNKCSFQSCHYGG